MFRFNKDMEYALIGLVEMSRSDELVSARTLSDRYSIPYKLLARVLQKLSSAGIVHAVKGPRGGYRLARTPEDTRLGSVIFAVRGPEKIADCLDDQGNCAQDDCGCTIKPIIRVFQDKWVDFVENTTLAEFAGSGDAIPAISTAGAGAPGSGIDEAPEGKKIPAGVEV